MLLVLFWLIFTKRQWNNNFFLKKRTLCNPPRKKGRRGGKKKTQMTTTTTIKEEKKMGQKKTPFCCAFCQLKKEITTTPTLNTNRILYRSANYIYYSRRCVYFVHVVVVGVLCFLGGDHDFLFIKKVNFCNRNSANRRSFCNLKLPAFVSLLSSLGCCCGCCCNRFVKACNSPGKSFLY